MSSKTIAALTAVLLLVACKTGDSGAPPTVSLEEAKRITAEFEGPSSKPPPRTIHDVLAVLEEPTGKEAARLSQYRAIADAEPPTTNDPIALWRFYRERGKAADFLGRTNQAISDQSKALRYVKSTGRNDPDSAGVNSRNDIRALGVMHYLIGEYDRAASLYEESYKLAPPDKTGARIAAISFLVFAYAELGRIEDADRAISRARSLVPKTYRWKKGAIWAPNLRALASLAEGAALVARGDYREAERLLRNVISEIDADMSATEAQAETTSGTGSTLREVQVKTKLWAHNQLAIALRRQDRLLEAEIQAREAVRGYVGEFGSNGGRTAHALVTLTETIMDQSRFGEARLLANKALELDEQLGAAEDSYPAARARRIVAAALAAERRWGEAAEAYLSLEATVGQRPRTRDRILRGDLTWALPYILTGRAEKAAAMLLTIYEDRQSALGDEHLETAEAGGLLASALAAQGERDQALPLFAATVPVLLSRSRGSETADTIRSLRHQRIVFVLEAYIGLLSETDDGTEAFRLAEAARSRSVQRAMAASGARAALQDPELSDLARREQDAQKRIAALYGLLANNPSGAAAKDLRTRIEQLRSARAVLTEEIEARFPDYAELVDPKPATVEQARAALRPGEALIATYVGEERTYVWAVPYRGEVKFAAVPKARDNVAFDVAFLRGALDPRARTLGDIPDFDLSVAYELYRTLFEPVKEGWQDASSLLVVAHGALGQLPFSLLPTEPVKLSREKDLLFANSRSVPWLARTHAVTVLPSVAALRTLRSVPPGDATRRAFVGFGDPWFSAEQAAAAQEPVIQMAALSGRGELSVRGLPIRLRSLPQMAEFDSAELAQLPRLPDTAGEVRDLALALNADLTRDVFTGKAANEHQVKTMDMSGYKVIAFATHGLVPGDLNGLTQPALALTSPQVAGVEGDGLLTMGEILGLKLDADWVVLSACNTAAAGGAGAEAVSGLGRAFFYAGTRALLVSNWAVHSASAKALTTKLFARQAADAGLSRAEALRQTMVDMIDDGVYADEASGKTVFSYAHPIFWAPFTLIGDGGGAQPSS